ncbi:glycosyltransferase family 1 protein [Bacillus megaterium]|nr:glycosyltransferase family 1 protein [Priestia megaterium]
MALSFKSKKMNTHFIKETLENGVTCLGIPDYYSFGRYSNISDRYFRKLKELVVGKSAIIYTIPIFKNIPKLVGINRVYYDCSDNWTESWLTGKESLKSKLIEKLKLQLVGKEEKSIIKGANKIFVSSIFLQQKVQYQNSGNKIQLVENGVDFSLFNTTNMPNESNSNTELSIGYIGGLKIKLT